MKHRFFALALAAAAPAGAVAFTQSAPGLSYLVTAIADRGEPITDFATADVTVREAGQPRKVLSVERPPFPLAVSLIVDGTQPPLGMTTAVRHVREALDGFVKTIRATSPGAKIELVEVGASATMLAGFDAKPEHLDESIATLFPAHPADAIILESFGDAAKRLSAMPTPRRAIVAIDFSSSESLTESTMKRVTDALQASGATVWSVSLRSGRSSQSRREGGLNLITRVSGGQRWVASESSGLPALLKIVANSLASQYLVTFARPDNSPPKEIRMESARGVKINVSLMRNSR